MGKLYAQERCYNQFQNYSSPYSALTCIYSSLTGALTNIKLSREMKLCDPTNIKVYSENKNNQPRAIHYKGDMDVHVTKKTLWKTKLDTFYA